MLDRVIFQGIFFSFLLMAASYTDIKRREIADAIPMFMALISLLNLKLTNQFGIVIGLPFLIAALLVEGSIGGGDIKLTGSAGMVLGFWKGIYGLILGLSFLVFFYLLLILRSKIRKRQVARNLSLPLAPFLGMGFMIIYFIT